MVANAHTRQDGSPGRQGMSLAEASRLGRFVALAATALAILMVSLGAIAAHADKRHRDRNLPDQGVYEHCLPIYTPSACHSRLRQIAGGGFSVVLNYAQLHSTRGELVRYARLANELGVRIVWPLKDPVWWQLGGNPAKAYPALAAACGCHARAPFLRWFVGLVRGLPATWGYYVGDETNPVNRLAVEALGDRLHRLDPRHPRLFIAQGRYPGRDLAPFAGAADVIGVDWYPIGFDLPLSTVSTQNARAARIARRNGRDTATVLQSFSWRQYPDVAVPHPRWPRKDELREMRNRALAAANPSLVLWYSYFDVRQSTNPARHWHDLLWAAFGRSS